VSVVLRGDLSLADLEAVAHGEAVELDAGALEAVAANRATLERMVDAGTPIYGITTGFGALVDQPVPAELRRRLQADLLRSHAAGTGPDLPVEVVRAALTVRLNTLLIAHSGIRPLVLERIADLLNAGLVPRVPQSGSLGASGDLAPSAHAFLPLIGEGEVRDRDGHVIRGAEALARLGVEPLELDVKEGLALINGTHFMSGTGGLLALRVQRLLDWADAAAAVTVEALRGAAAAFDPRVHQLRPLEGQIRSARNVAAMIEGSSRIRRQGHGSLQDPYSLRCVPQVHGAAREAASFFRRLIGVDLNAVTDNPLVFDDPPSVVSAGNFHGQSLSLAFDTIRLALADLGSISERRTFRLVSPSLNGVLPAFLTAQPGAASGYMIAQYSAAALVAELRALAHPVSVDSIPTSDNQEDHVSMGMTSAVMSWEAISRVERLLAIELMCACQALDLDPGAAGGGTERIRHEVRRRVPMLLDDRPPADDIAALADLFSLRMLDPLDGGRIDLTEVST
jgi:histidine ammonia-lyase